MATAKKDADKMAPNGPEHVEATSSGDGADNPTLRHEGEMPEGWQPKSSATNIREADTEKEKEDWVYVTMPDGQTRAISRKDVEESQRKNQATLAAGINIPALPEDDEEYYVHLADGSVEKMKSSELPPAAGTNAMNGYFERDGHTHHVIGVYPVETENPKG